MEQFYGTVIDYIEGASNFRDMAVSKIASLEKENRKLKQQQGTTTAFKGLVSKMASAGIIDDLNAAYFSNNTSSGNIEQQIGKLSALIRQEASSKQADIPSPYKVSKQSVTRTKNSAKDIAEARLRNIRPTK